LLHTILKEDHIRTIPDKFALMWSSGSREYLNVKAYDAPWPGELNKSLKQFLFKQHSYRYFFKVK